MNMPITVFAVQLELRLWTMLRYAAGKQLRLLRNSATSTTT